LANEKQFLLSVVEIWTNWINSLKLNH